MVNKAKRDGSINHFSIIFQKFVGANRSTPKKTELAKEQYKNFFDVVDQNEIAFSDFDYRKHRFDASSQIKWVQVMNL